MNRPTITAGWLTLRPFTAGDVPWVYSVLLDPAVQRFMQIPSPYRREDAASLVEREYIAGGDGGRRADFLAEDAATATRLGRAACQWAVTTAGIELIEWRCQAGNTASRRVAEKAGFLFEGTLRQRRVQHGVRVDEWVGSLLRNEVNAASDRI